MAGFYDEVQVCSSCDAGRLLTVDVQSATNITASIEDQVFQDKGGGFSYKHNQGFSRATRNRHIFWKVSQNCIFLTEISQDLHLFGNQLRLVLKNVTILPNVSIHETENAIFIIIATALSVHRLSWPHPVKESQGSFISSSIDASSESIFCNNPTGMTSDSWCFSSLPKKCQSFSAYQLESGECLVPLVGFDGSLIYVTLPSPRSQEAPQIHELKQKSIMQRLWTGLIPTVLRSDDVAHDGARFCEIHSIGGKRFIFTLCKDLKIRIWSCQSLECIREFDLTPLLPYVLDAQSGIAQSYLIRKAVDEETDSHYLWVFLNFQFQSQFFAFELFEDDGEIDLSFFSSHFSKLTTLVDFCLTSSHIWVLWTSGTGGNIVQFTCIEQSDGNNTTWQDVTLQPNDSTQVFVHHSTEPKEIYLSNLFMPGRFSRNVLLKTIQITAESFDENIELKVSANSSVEEMQAAVEYLVDCELSDLTSDSELDQEEYYGLQTQCWAKFYASATQYNQVERKPIGLYSDRETGLVTVIRQNYWGYMTPSTWVQWLYQQEDSLEEQNLKHLHNQAGIVDHEIANDVLELIKCMKMTSMQFTQSTFSNLEYSIASNDDVMEICSALARDLFTDSSDSVDVIGDVAFTANFIRSIQLKLKDRPNLLSALQILIDAVDPLKWLPVDFENADQEMQLYSTNASHSYSSKEGRAIITESIYNTARSHMEICRDCLLLVNVLLCMQAPAGNFDETKAALESRFIPKLHALMRSFFTVVWLRRSTFRNDDVDIMEKSLKKFAALELIDGGGAFKKSRWDDLANKSILGCFVNQVGIRSSLNIFARLPAESQKDETNAYRPWNYDFKLISDMIFRSLWPCRDGTELPEFILSQGQASLLSEYLFVCSDWCENNCGSREFLMAQAFLQNGDDEKARQHFFKAAKFIGNGESFLSRLIPNEEPGKLKMIISYFVMIMRLFEQFDNPEMMIVVATAAIFIAKNSKFTEVAMLWSNIFKCHLQLGHMKEAYQAIVRNPDNQRRRNCLHNFVVTLCERKQFHELCTFSYSSLEDEVVKIIETRARTVDITVNDYYDILYAFHSFRGDMRRAATVMYEYACRLRTEMHGLASLQQQAKCYLAAINSLRICDEKYAWIARPSETVIETHEEVESFSQGRSPKRRENGEEISLEVVDRKKGTKRTVLVELPDLEKEYLLIVARLNLLQFEKNPSSVVAANLSPSEIVPLLCQAGLFDRAFAVAMTFKINLSSIFEGIVSKCVRLASDVAQGVLNNDAFNWLTVNDLGTSASISDISAVEQAWRLLRSYLAKFTSMNGPIYHKAIAAKLLSLSCNLPTWFVNDYKQKNAAELLRVYIDFDMLEAAGELAVEYINAVLGIGKESFDIEHAVHATSPAVWLPYTALDQLIALLKDYKTKPNLSEVHQDLTEKLEQYFDIVEKASNDKINLAYKRMAVIKS